MFTGVEAIITKAKLADRLYIDLGANSFSRGYDPIDWFKNPDVFWLGAGISYSF